MSKKLKPTGKKLKNLSDPSLAHSHKAGATVHFMQTATDPQWGRYLYDQYRRYGLILNESLKYYKKTVKLLNQCRQIKVEEKSGFRTLPLDLRNKLEINSLQFIVLTKLGIEYLVAEYELPIKRIKDHRKESYTRPLDSDDLANRLKILKDAIGITTQIPQEIYTLLDRRDIAEHPTVDRLFNGSDTGWKTVNLSWVLSGDIEGIIDPVIVFINEFIKTVEAYIQDNPIPGTLTGLTRGLKAGEQYKKPKEL